MDRKHFERKYELAALKLRMANSEADRQKARRTLTRMKLTASELFGLDFVDDLHEQFCSSIRKAQVVPEFAFNDCLSKK